MAGERSAVRPGAAVGGGPFWRRRWVWWSAGALAVLAGISLFLLRPFWKLASHFEEITFQQPSRLYAQPEKIETGRAFSAQRMVKDLNGEGYREAVGAAPLAPGRYRVTEAGLAVHLRSFFLPDGSKGGGLLEVAFRGPRIVRIWLNGQTQASTVLEPPLLASYYGPDQLERRPVTVDDVAEDLIESVIAAEDDNFFTHSGVAPTSILRALWVNLRGGQVRQGGSTLTQQVVKNIYLTQERKLARKVEEAVLAVMLEMRYSKREILTAYLNEIYLGRSGGVNVMGVGAASRAYFGKDASQLTLAEAATLAGIIPAPSSYSPLTHPDRAKERRDWVLHRLADLRRIDKSRIDEALASPVVVSPEPLARRRAPYFADAMEAEAATRFKVDDLADGGYSLYSTLGWEDQQAAQAAVDTGLAAAEKGYERNSKESLQVALISVQPETGGILAYLGGRRYEQSQFDRVSQAHRQTGSSFKPVVYAAAFEGRKATPASFLEDEPLEVAMGQTIWSPKNDDGEFHGWVTVRTALEHSYNPATARLALQVGIPKIVKLAHALGITTEMPPFPAVALGSTAVAPIELATVFASFAAGGVRPPVHGLTAVVDSRGKPVAGAPLPAPERAVSPQTAFLVTSLMIGVLERGTGAGAAPQLRGRLAGKTGTTNDRRDSWFGGFSPDRATVVWVGHDDNTVTRLSGARAALPVWSHFMVAVTPPGGYSTFAQPEGIRSALIDPESGMLATDNCPEVFTEVFRQGEEPTELCTLHQGLSTEQGLEPPPPGARPDDFAAAPPTRSDERSRAASHPFRRWLHRLFNGGNDKDDDDAGAKAQDDGRPHAPPPGGKPADPRSGRNNGDDEGPPPPPF
jgi:penicillin-binding protein 1B